MSLIDVFWSFGPENTNTSVIKRLWGHWCDLGSADCVLSSKLRDYIKKKNKQKKTCQHTAHWFLRQTKSQNFQVGQRPWALSLEHRGEVGSSAGLAALIPQAWKCGSSLSPWALGLIIWPQIQKALLLQLLKFAKSHDRQVTCDLENFWHYLFSFVLS